MNLSTQALVIVSILILQSQWYVKKILLMVKRWKRRYCKNVHKSGGFFHEQKLLHNCSILDAALPYIMISPLHGLLDCTSHFCHAAALCQLPS